MKNNETGKKLMERHKQYTGHEAIIQGADTWCSKCLYGTPDNMGDFNVAAEEAKKAWD